MDGDSLKRYEGGIHDSDRAVSASTIRGRDSRERPTTGLEAEVEQHLPFKQDFRGFESLLAHYVIEHLTFRQNVVTF